MLCRTRTVQKSLNPVFDEFFELSNLPAGATLMVEVWDKDMVTDDDIIGRACWQFVPKEVSFGMSIDSSLQQLLDSCVA